MLRQLFLLLIILTISCSAIAQVSYFNLALVQDEQFNFREAIRLYKLAIDEAKTKRERSLAAFKIGNCYDFISNFDSAIIYFKLSYKFEKRDKETLYSIATECKKAGRYADALKYFKKYYRKGENKTDALREISGYETILKWITNPEPYTLRIDNDLSSLFSDFAPRFIDENNKSMIFTSTRNFADSISGVLKNTNLFYSKYNGGKWTVPELLDSAVNNSNRVGVISIDQKRKVIFFTRCSEDGRKSCSTYYSFMKGDLMGEPLPLNLGINSKATVGHPFFSNEYDILFFASDMPGGYGGKDIWLSKYNRETDSWSRPENLGVEVNSSGDELYPYLTPDGTLYFTSDGHLGLGGWDNFKANKTGDTQWGHIENLKSPINSEADDFGIMFNSDSKSGYFTSNRKGGLGADDIYEFSSNEIISEAMEEISVSSDDEPYNALVKLLNQNACEENENALALSAFTIYPNPGEGNFTLEFSSNKPVALTIKIHSSMGQLIQVLNINPPEGKFSRHIRIPELKNGIYYLHVFHDCENLHTEKIIIQR